MCMSMRPGRSNAGSIFSLWLVVNIITHPSPPPDLKPSMKFSKFDRLNFPLPSPRSFSISESCFGFDRSCTSLLQSMSSNTKMELPDISLMASIRSESELIQDKSKSYTSNFK
ncbi:hypothetical protein VIGAN_10159100 [Vigna angularis var. angularis]|uniref:Uncharacterized protein n=1 Tax=Vigna angularis var. angularis TaxID=157739 RepID=A0A0S3T556_PHAAN|nr:hypothetical protein VIGAN_10159100 [Vigna angularis var. angularis]